MITYFMVDKIKILSIISIYIFDNTLGFYMNIKIFLYNFSCCLVFKKENFVYSDENKN